jgi:hypothetical protein
MAIGNAALVQAEIKGSPENPESLAKDFVERWCATCTNFLRWERDHILKGEPSAKEREDHRQLLKRVLRLTRVIHSIAADPDFPNRAAAELLEMKLWQLNESWKTIYEPVSEEEAKAVLNEVFPGWNES